MNFITTHKTAGLIVAALVAGLSIAWGDVTYTLQFDPASSPERQQVANSVAEAAAIYNTWGSFNKHWNVYYDPGIPTAQASYSGYMGFGSQRTTRTALHEGGHTMGVGQHGNYWVNMVGGVWQGNYGHDLAIEMGSPYADGVHGDNTHYWPWGLNQEGEDGYLERIKLVRILAAMRCDMGIMAYNKEAENELAYTGETAEFHVESPVASSYQWYRNGSPLSNGGDISGADSDTLRIANAEAADEGSYYCRVYGAGEYLNSRPRQLFVEPLQQLGQWDMDGNVADSVNINNGTAYGSPAYVSGVDGQAIDLDGVNDYVDLPDAIGHTKEMTVTTWVNWDGGGDWQRIFDFGTGSYQYMFLTPKSGGGTLRLVFRDAKNGVSADQQINTSVLPTGQWVHLAAVLHEGYATLYVNGQAVGSVAVPVTDLVDFLPTNNYIGKSQFNDPLFNGRIDDFRVYNYAFSGAEVWDLWGQSANSVPVFSTNSIVLADVELAAPYTGQSIAGYATDLDLDDLTFEKADGPAWLSVSPNGTLSGNPGSADLGDNVFHVRVTDPAGASSDAEVRIRVTYPSTWVKLNGTVIGTPGSWGGNPALARQAAFDGDFGTYYDAVNENGDWTGLDLGSTEQIILVKYAPRAGFASRMVGGRFQGSNTADFSSGVVTLYTIGAPPDEGSFTQQILTDPNTYRYVRYIGPDGGFCNVTEIEFYSPGEPNFDGDPVLAGTSIGTTGSWGGNPDLTRDGALDGDLTTYYDAVNATGDWVGMDLGQDYVLSRISYAPRHGFAHRMVGGVFEASNTPDFSSGVVTLYTVPSSPMDAIYTTVLIPDPAAYRYVRYVGPANGYCNVAEIVLQGVDPAMGGFDGYMAGYGIPGALFGDDANANGIPNGMEYFLGWNPTNMSPAGRVFSWTNGCQCVVYPFNPTASGVCGSLEWTTDLMSGNWHSTGVSYTTNTLPNEIEADLGYGTTNKHLFIRLKVENQ